MHRKKTKRSFETHVPLSNIMLHSSFSLPLNNLNKSQYHGDGWSNSITLGWRNLNMYKLFLVFKALSKTIWWLFHKSMFVACLLCCQNNYINSDTMFTSYEVTIFHCSWTVTSLYSSKGFFSRFPYTKIRLRQRSEQQVWSFKLNFREEIL